MKINVRSEINNLKAVMLHRPGKELENLTPDTLEELLFDDIPFLEVAQKEHDAFANILKDRGVEVYYLVDVVTETIESSGEADKELMETFLDEAIEDTDAIIDKKIAREKVRSLLLSYPSKKERVSKMIEGVRVEDIDPDHNFTKKGSLFLCKPMPNLYFQRDPFVSVGSGVTVNRMYSVTRNRETLFSHIIFKHHPTFKKDIKRWYDREENYSIEGGDILILNDKTLAIGMSQRTQEEAILKFANTILKAEDENFENIVALDIGKTRKYMHLDTVFTQVDKDKYTVHPDVITDDMRIIEINLENNEIKSKKSDMKIIDVLKKYTGEENIELIKCGGDDEIASAREQWNDGANTLAIAPGEVVVYSRNTVTNKILEEKGIKLNIIPSAELSRGRGGPRCMSMPLVRK